MTNPNTRTRIKVCGITTLEAANAAVDAGADAVGFVLVEDTPRYIEPEQAAAIMYSLPPFIGAVGVVQDLDVDQFCELEYACPAHTMQLHGKEPVDTVQACGPGVIKAFKYEDATINSQLTRWAKVEEVDALLIDGSAGGTGETFDWSNLAPLIKDYPKKIIIAGGLDASNVGQVIETLRPYAVDVSSGVEDAPGVKNLTKIAEFCAAVRAADAK
tara:strand:+ start:133946 stop:134590 length:645 start_codon:yes stop_codon:yes gene_type:complete